ncbi:uncharacterized protein LOC119988660 isoform X2 [Tripterygium wilfordii]|nr:uncharacterized protein LOC119988660 isoform X2 [Tripterygium wilfordii]
METLKWLETNGVAGRKKPTHTSSPSTPISVNLAKDSSHSVTFINRERSMGKKADKAKQKKRKGRKGRGVDGSPLSDFICEWKVEKLKMHEHKMKIEKQKLMLAMQELVVHKEVEENMIQLEERQEDARRKIEEKRIKFEERQVEMRIMMMDVSTFK